MTTSLAVRSVGRQGSAVSTYTWQLGAAVTALGGSAALLDVKNAELTTGGLDDTGPVGGGVVAGGGKEFLVSIADPLWLALRDLLSPQSTNATPQILLLIEVGGILTRYGVCR